MAPHTPRVAFACRFQRSLCVGLAALLCANCVDMSGPAALISSKGEVSLAPDISEPAGKSVIRRELMNGEPTESLSEIQRPALPPVGAWKPIDEDATQGTDDDDTDDSKSETPGESQVGVEPALDPDLHKNKTHNETQNAQNLSMDVQAVTVTLSPKDQEMMSNRDTIADLKADLNATQMELLKLEEKLEKETAAVSYVFLALWIVVMLFFYAAHSARATMRFVVYKTLSDALSLFCAALLFDTLKGFMDIVQHRLFPGGAMLFCSFFRFVSIFLIVEGSLNFSKGKPLKLAAWGKVGAFILGFASIDAFGSMQETYFAESASSAFDGVMVCLMCMVIMCGFAKFVRFGSVPEGYNPDAVADEEPPAAEGAEGGEGAGEQAVPAEETGDVATNRWLDQCDRSENEAMAFVLGLLLSQVVRFQILGFMPPLYGGFGATNVDQLRSLAHAAAVFGLAMVPCALLKSVLRGSRMVWSDGQELYTFTLPPEFERYVDILVETMGMGMAWCLMFLGTWLYKSQTSWGSELHVGARMTVKVSMAFAFTIFGMGISLLIMWKGTKFIALVNAIVFLIGLTWQKTFMEAIQIFGFAGEHTMGIVRLTLCLYVMPAWYWYLLPHALPKEEKDTAKMVDNMLAQMGAKDGPEAGAAAAS